MTGGGLHVMGGDKWQAVVLHNVSGTEAAGKLWYDVVTASDLEGSPLCAAGTDVAGKLCSTSGVSTVHVEQAIEQHRSAKSIASLATLRCSLALLHPQGSSQPSVATGPACDTWGPQPSGCTCTNWLNEVA